MTFRNKLLPFAVLGALAAADAQAALLVDSFDNTAQNVIDTRPAGIATNGPTGGAPLVLNPGDTEIAGPVTRTVGGESIAVTTSQASSISVLIDDLGSNILEVNNSTFSDGGSTVKLQYSFGSTDFLAAGSALALQVLIVDTSTQVQMTVTDALFNTSTTGFVNFGGTGTFYRAFVNFAGAADFTQITNVTLDFKGTTAWDAAFDVLSVESVPEPATLALLSVGLLGIGTLRKKRNG